MAHDVFLSYSSKDKHATDAACAVLERAGVRVWMASRDNLAGLSWAASILSAINNARVMVLVFSEAANSSPYLEREVERAINKGLPVILFRIEDAAPSGALEYFISANHWLDAFTKPLEPCLDRLAEMVRRVIEVKYGGAGHVGEEEAARRAEEQRKAEQALREKWDAERGEAERRSLAERQAEEERRGRVEAKAARLEGERAEAERRAEPERESEKAARRAAEEVGRRKAEQAMRERREAERAEAARQKRERAGPANGPDRVAPAELELWRAITQDVRPFGHRPLRHPPDPAPEALNPAPASATPAREKTESAGRVPPVTGIDDRTRTNLRRGRLEVDVKLDLHGMRQQEAQRALFDFLYRAQAENAKVVIVVTGKGLSSESGGVMRRMVPMWLQAPNLRDIVVSFGEAARNHGAEGALYVGIRRLRRPDVR
jgi:DNA-nicking Smr family endonuclease